MQSISLRSSLLASNACVQHVLCACDFLMGGALHTITRTNAHSKVMMFGRRGFDEELRDRRPRPRRIPVDGSYKPGHSYHIYKAEP
jgi:hypothetical protein